MYLGAGLIRTRWRDRRGKKFTVLRFVNKIGPELLIEYDDKRSYVTDSVYLHTRATPAGRQMSASEPEILSAAG